MSAADPYSLPALQDAVDTIRKCQEGRINLPELKARTPLRDAPYQEHRTDPWIGFEKTRTLPIPNEVFEGIKGASPTATQALFPEIRRACITVDNKLYLWNYLEGQSAFEYHNLSEDQLILSVGLVPARSGVFIDSIKHVLVLSTGISSQEGKSLTLLGLEFVIKDGQTQVKLYETGMSVQTNGLVLSDIQGTSGGRIFAKGSDHCLYELVYQANEGWFTNKCYLRNITSPRFSNLLPTFIKAEKRLDRIAVDDARNLVYTLREGSLIEVFQLPSKDASRPPNKTGSTSGTTKQAGLTHSQQDIGNIVWIGPAERDSRAGVVLIAVTEKGHRIFFDDFQGRTWAPLQVRVPPGLSAINPPAPTTAGTSTALAPTNAVSQAGRTVSSVLSAGDIFMIGFNFSSAPGQVCCISPAPSGPSNTTGSPVEAATFVSLELALSAPVMAEARPLKPIVSISDNGELVRPTVAQALRPPRSFLILDNNGLSEVVERRPVDMLRGLLEMGLAVNSAAIIEFFSMFGPVEACATAVEIAAHNSQASLARTSLGSLGTSGKPLSQMLSDEVVSQAARIFFSQYGSWPADARMPTALATPRTSRHNGLALYLACLFKRFFDKLLVTPEPPKPGAKPAPAPSSALTTYKPALASTASKVPLTKDDLQDALQELVPLLDFMQRHSKLFGLGGSSNTRSFLGNTIDFDQERTAKLDQESFERIKALTSRTIEAINFVLFLMDHGLAPLINACSADAKKTISTLRFGQLLTTQEGKNVSKELVTALIEARIGAQVSIDAVADALQSRCGSFCSADDVRQYKATECIRRAKETRSEKEKADQLRLSQRLLSKGAGQLSPDKLKAVSDDFRSLGYPIGVIDLALQCAADWDPAGVAISYRADGCPDDTARREVWDKRKKAYAIVFDTLKELDDQLDAAYNIKDTDAKIQLEVERRDKVRSDAYARAEASSDPLFHEQLYIWLIDRRLTDQLLQLRTPYLADYLQGQPAGDKAGDMAYVRTLRNLLWQYYVRVGEYFAAAQVLDALAHSKEFGLELRERIEYLALAVGNAKSVGPVQAGAHDVVAFLSQVEEDLEVAQVQAKILQSIRQLDADGALQAESIEWLDDELLDLSTLYKNFAEPFELLEEQLMIIAAAEYQDIGLVAETWTALITREHVANGAEHTGKAIASLVRDLFTRLGRAENACPTDVVLDLLLRYAFEQQQRTPRIDNPVPAAWAPRGGADAGAAIPVGWAPVTVMAAGAPGEYVLDVLEGAIATAPPPWNTNAGHRFLLAQLAEFISVWVQRTLEQPTADPTFPVDRLFETINALIVKTGTGSDQDTLAKLRASVDLLKTWY